MKNKPLKSVSYSLKISTKLKDIFLLITIWICMIILVNPIGDFPLNDDWAYGWTIKNLLETGRFQLSDWTAANLLSQVIWGTVFCLPFGFSFTALRISVLILGLVGVLSTYGLLREIKTSPKIAFLGALVVALNPIYFELSNSFNNDVPSFAFAISSLYFIVRGLRLNSSTNLIVGILISFVSILNRQSGIVILLAFGPAFLANKGVKLRTIILACLPTVLGLILQLVYSQWLQSQGQLPILYGFQIELLLKTFLSGLLSITSTYSNNVVVMSVYLGLFLFPFLAIYFVSWYKPLSTQHRRLCLLGILLMIAMGTALILQDHQMPFTGNILQTFGLGPHALDGYYSFSSDTQTLITIIWKLLTIVGFIGSALLFQYLILTLLEIFGFSQKLEMNKKWLLFLVASITLLYLLFIAGTDYWFDRYLILLLPVLMMLVSILISNLSNKRLNFGVIILSLSILLFYGGYTVTATHDYLGWNRVRWQALNQLVQDTKVKVPPEQIDGGFEFNGWYLGNRLETCNPKYKTEPKPVNADWDTFVCLWGDTNHQFNYKYTIGFKAQPGYIIDKQYSFRRWLPLRDDTLYLLQKDI